ncbi:MAG: hypothetical protein J5520_07375 [Bacteroidales bacterium]|nr:hypothetical protein [Bacteroidales bacterium]
MKYLKHAVIFVSAVAILAGCAMQRKLESLRKGSSQALISIADENEMPELVADELSRDTLTITGEEGQEVLIMKAVKDDETGEMVATDVIKAAKVTARFRNLAERHGKVDLCFDVTVPSEMQDSKWQLRFRPEMWIMEDTVALDPVIITGKDYRKAQLKGYEHYRKFLESIITDSTLFINTSQLEVFLKRNLPQVFRLRTDSSYVSDEAFASMFGVTEKQAVKHYTSSHKINRNNRRIARKDKMFRKYVKAPIITEGLRLDTVITGDGDEFIYRYVQTINTRPRLRKVEITLSGEIFDQGTRLYTMPESDPLTFYISSLSTLADNREKYISKVVERNVAANTACYIDFKSGSWEIDTGIEDNVEEISRIQGNLANLISNKTFGLDSIIVTASCSPEGSYASNAVLSKKRSESVSRFFDRYIKRCKDSLRQKDGLVIDLEGIYKEDKAANDIRFISRNTPENWEMLDRLVASDTSISLSGKRRYMSLKEIRDPDIRENSFRAEKWYRYLREQLYPSLRTVRFDFYLHRIGMVKDTVHTTVLDTTYMNGLQAIRDRDYKKAVTLLRPYGDYNTAVAYCALDYNASALDILERLPRSGKTNYMLAIIYSRTGRVKEAVQCYMDACSSDRSFVSRGNLDPEISALIARYGLNRQDDY